MYHCIYKCVLCIDSEPSEVIKEPEENEFLTKIIHHILGTCPDLPFSQ